MNETERETVRGERGVGDSNKRGRDIRGEE